MITQALTAQALFLNIHIKLCIVCGKFNKQVIEGQDMCCNYKKHEEAGLFQQPGMDPARKEALKKLLSEQSSDSDLAEPSLHLF